MIGDKLFLIYYWDHPLATVEMKFAHPPSVILDWYAKEYGFKRKSLGWSIIEQVTYPDNKDAREDDNKSVCDFT